MGTDNSTPQPGQPTAPGSEAEASQPVPAQQAQPPVPPASGYGGGQPPGGAQPPPKRGRGVVTVIVIVLILLGLALASIVGLALLVSSITDTEPSGLARGEKVGVVMVQGVIMSGGRGSPLFGGPAGSRAIMADVRAAKDEKDIKAVVLYVNSPGGSAAASQAIYKEVAALAEKKPVIAAMDDVAASGGYYVACGADKIMANGSTMTGSIGVIMSGIAYYGLMDKIGVDDHTITSGKYKDIGSPWRPMQPDERQLLQGLVQDVYDQFVDAVAEGRDMPREKVLELADGKIFTGRQALKLGLVDELGSYYDAVELAGKEGGIKGEPKVKIFGGAEGLWGELFGAEQLFPFSSRHSLLNLSGPMLIEPFTYNNLMLQAMPVRLAP